MMLILKNAFAFGIRLALVLALLGGAGLAPVVALAGPCSPQTGCGGNL